MEVVVAAGPDGVHLTQLPEGAGTTVTPEELPARVAELEDQHPRWVWADTAVSYPPLLRAGVRVARCHDLRLCHTILRHARLTEGSALATAPPGPWDLAEEHPGDGTPTLLDALGPALRPADVLAEHDRQQQAVAGSAEPGRLALLLAAESVGALVAAEMSHDGLPFST
ncbi:bifunctional 3'-5' exonuclease/DNA polymerase, partial [Georgenia sp. 10Sc9-8]|nr:bifunctional 3'-5' exonuclease/DNA polymerase [Georgenia halotolerans]